MSNRVNHRKLGRESSHRRALLRNLARDLVQHGQIKTTLSKAKELRPYIEKMVTTGKRGGLSNHRRIYTVLKSRELVRKFTGDIENLYKERKGGYTRVVKAGFRLGDSAPMACIAFIKSLL